MSLSWRRPQKPTANLTSASPARRGHRPETTLGLKPRELQAPVTEARSAASVCKRLLACAPRMPREMKVHFNGAYQLCQYARTVRRRPACVLCSCVFHLDAQVGRLPRHPERVACSSILRLKICTGGSRTCHLFPFRLRLLILSFRGTLEAPSMLAANVFAPNVSRNQPRQPGGKMKSQPYWTRQVVASMGVQEMRGFICKPREKKAYRPSWCLSGLTSSTLKMKCKVRPKAFPVKLMVWPMVAGPSGSLRYTWTSAENHSE